MLDLAAGTGAVEEDAVEHVQRLDAPGNVVAETELTYRTEITTATRCPKGPPAGH